MLNIRFHLIRHMYETYHFSLCFQIMVEPRDGQGLEVEETFGDERRELSVCEECGRSDRRHLMLLCSACDSR